MCRLVAERFVRRAYENLDSHDLDAIVGRFTEDGVFHFPGDHVVSGDYRGRARNREFFARLFELFPGLRFEAQDFAIHGPPWNMRLFVRYADWATAPNGTRRSGEGLRRARLSWGKLKHDFIVNDTKAVGDYLRQAWPEAVAHAGRDV